MRKAFCQNCLDLFLILRAESLSYLENSLVLDTYAFECCVSILLIYFTQNRANTFKCFL